MLCVGERESASRTDRVQHGHRVFPSVKALHDEGLKGLQLYKFQVQLIADTGQQ